MAAIAFVLRPSKAEEVAAAATPTDVSLTRGTALTVTITRPTAVLWPDVVSANGAIAAWQEASVSAEIAGARLTEVLVDVGDKVARGQTLATFDDAQARALYAQQRALLAEAAARLEEATANLKRAQEMQSTNAMSEQDLIKAKTAAQSGLAQFDLATARLETQQLNLNNTRVVAPDAGTISARNAMLGAVVAPGAELFRLVRQDRLEWRAELTAASLGRVKAGDSAEIRLPDEQTVTGTVRQVAPMLDASTRTGIVFIELASAMDSSARVGMFAAGTINVGSRAGLAVPATTIVHRDGHQYLFIVDDEGGRVAQKKVQTGRRSSGAIEILAGISPEDAVVENGAAFLSEGDRVHVVDVVATRSQVGIK